VDAWRAEGPAAGPGGDLPALEVAEELGPFLVGGRAVFLAGPQGAAAGQERQVGLDGLFGVDGLVSDRDVDIAVPGDDLGDVRWQAAEDRICDEQPAEIVRGEVQRPAAGRVGQPGMGERGGEHVTDRRGADGPVLEADATLEQQRRGRRPGALAVVVGAGERDRAAGRAETADDHAEHVRQFRGHDKKSLLIGLRGGDLQQRHEFPGAGQPVLNQAVV